MFPSGYKEDKIYSLKPTDGSGDLDFTRASTATRVNAEGLIEESPVNLLTYSNTFSNAAWFNINTTETSGQSGYDGSNNAWLLQRSAAYGLIRQFVDSDGDTTFSVYVKKGSLSWVRLYIASNTLSSDVYINLENGAIGTKTGSPSVEVVDLGSGWYRCTISKNTTLINNFRIYPAASNEDTTGTSGNIYIQDAQVNSGATAKTYFPTTDRLNVPRIDYTGGGCGKLLLEPQRTNLALYSEQLNSGVWTKNDTTITANATTSPDGTTNADTINLSAGTSQKFIAQSYSQNGSYTQSVYLKKGTHSFVQLLTGGDVTKFATFDLINGTSSVTGGTATIQAAANGFYRCTFSYTTSTGTNITIIAVDSLAAARAAATSSTGNFYIYGAQLELGSYVSSYIPTSGTAVTRLADAAYKTGISSLIGQTEGTLFVEVDLNNIVSGDSQYAIVISDGSAANRIQFLNNISNDWQLFITANTISNNISLTTSTSGVGIYKIAIAYKSGDVVYYINGIQKGTSSETFTFSTLTDFDLAQRYDDLFPLQNPINQAILFPTRLTNNQLADLTGGNKTTFNALAEFYGYQIL